MIRSAVKPRRDSLRRASGAKAGGSAWESNPASPRERGATDFEDREGHRAPFASDAINCSGGCDRPMEDPRAGTRSTGSAFDQPHVTGARAFGGFLGREFDA